MKIVEETPYSLVQFNELPAGSVFLWNDEFYLKISRTDTDGSDVGYQAVTLEMGVLYRIANGTPVVHYPEAYVRAGNPASAED